MHGAHLHPLPHAGAPAAEGFEEYDGLWESDAEPQPAFRPTAPVGCPASGERRRGGEAPCPLRDRSVRSLANVGCDQTFRSPDPAK